MPCPPTPPRSTPLVIAIDGPAASGKSSVGHELARRLGFLFFDTGAMYRAVTLAAIRRHIPIDDEQQITRLANELPIHVQPPAIDDGRRYTVLVGEDDVTWELRGSEVDAHVSAVSAYPGVRRALTRQQRRIASQGNVVMAGRDIGTVVFPEAPLKIYLDASAAERARRRYEEQLQRQQAADYEAILRGVRERDQIDSHRPTAPLRIASDAVVLQTDDLEQQEVVAAVLKLVHERLHLEIHHQQVHQ
ncbi:MAG: (d)CMP kinase [Chloroflexi bacterium]|nr:(d)CMP kinase [Chloroflexota bacterium]